MRQAAAAAALALLAALPATAQQQQQDRPPLYPSRDVSVAYRAEGGPEGPAEIRISWLNAERKLRTDMPGGQGWQVVEVGTGRVFIVNDAERSVMRLPPAPPGALSQHSPSARFTRGGTETILGQRCTLWRFQDGQDQGEACLTADGVMLRSRATAGGGEGAGSMTATDISLGAQDPARFRAPAGYREVPLPPAPPGAPGGAPGGAPPGRR